MAQTSGPQTQSDGKSLNVCDVCRLLDNDLSLKICSFCQFCSAWICENDLKRPDRHCRRYPQAKKHVSKHL